MPTLEVTKETAMFTVSSFHDTYIKPIATEDSFNVFSKYLMYCKKKSKKKKIAHLEQILQVAVCQGWGGDYAHSGLYVSTSAELLLSPMGTKMHPPHSDIYSFKRTVDHIEYLKWNKKNQSEGLQHDNSL